MNGVSYNFMDNASSTLVPKVMDNSKNKLWF